MLLLGGGSARLADGRLSDLAPTLLELMQLPQPAEMTGVSLLRYAGDGKFSYEEDLLNMTHVNEDLRAAGWRPRPGFVMPPSAPNRKWSRPS